MANVNFYLKDSKDKNKETSIYFRIFTDNNSIKVSTGLKVKPKFWNPKQKEAREVDNFPGAKALNKELDIIRNKAKNALESLENNFTPITPENFKNALTLEGRRVKTAKSIDLITFIEKLIDECKNGKRLNPTGRRFSENTIKGYNTTLFHLNNFIDETGYKLNFETLNMNFYHKFMEYFNRNKKAVNTIFSHVKNVKVFAREAEKNGIKVNPEIWKRDFKTVHEETDMVYLTDTELEKIYNLDLSNDPKLDRVRDVFLIGCYTGLRFGDLSSLNETSLINDGSLIKIKTQKTGETVTIPLHWTVKAILEKYNHIPPRPISNQKMNDYIKDVCELAEITDSVMLTKTKGGRTVGVTVKKHKAVSTHTARRSFASNLFLAGVPSIAIMKITGHRTEKAFMKYIRISGEDNATKLLEHPYFQQSPLRVAK